MIGSFLTAIRFLTILPLGRPMDVDSALVVRSSKFYPLAGLVLGALFWGFYRLALFAFPTETAAGLLLAFWVLMTGALHLDGLADSLDGCYGGRTPFDRLRIMKDVQVGTMGIVGLIGTAGVEVPPTERGASAALRRVLVNPDPPSQSLDPGFSGRLLALRPAGRRFGSRAGPGNEQKRAVLGHYLCLGDHHRGGRLAGIRAHGGPRPLESTGGLVLFPEARWSNRGQLWGGDRNG